MKHLIQSVDKKFINRRQYADELTLFSLSWLYKQHTIVITANKLWSTLHSNTQVSEEVAPDFVMVPVAAGGSTKPTTLYQSMQSQPVAKPSTVSMPKSKTVPGTGISIIKVEKAAADKPLPVETSPANSATNTNDCTQYTGNVEMKGLDNSTERVATEMDTVNSQVETAHCIQNTVHVETSSLEEISTDPSIPQTPEDNISDAEPSTSVTMTPVTSSNTGENGAVREVADSLMEIEKDTSM